MSQKKINNEGISHDVIENKDQEKSELGISHDVYDKK